MADQAAVNQMPAAFPNATVADDEDLISRLTNHPKDRHVLAAGVAVNADVLMTANIDDFPSNSAEPYGLIVQTPDEFLNDLYVIHAADLRRIITEQAAAYRRPPRAVAEVLAALAIHAPIVVARMAAEST